MVIFLPFSVRQPGTSISICACDNQTVVSGVDVTPYSSICTPSLVDEPRICGAAVGREKGLLHVLTPLNLYDRVSVRIRHLYTRVDVADIYCTFMPLEM